MDALLLFLVIDLTLASGFALSEGTMMRFSQEFTVYANQNLTLSCQPRDSPPHLVFWYKTDMNNKDHEDYLSTGPSYTITKATVNDTAIYVCSGTEWGAWGIKSYIMVNVIEPGEPSCANGWSRYNNACYMCSARTIRKMWNKAESYCAGSKARLAQVSYNRDDLHFMRDLVKHRNESSFWIASARSADGRQPPRRGRQAQPPCSRFSQGKRAWKTANCATLLPFICQRVLPGIPKDVTIDPITSFTARVGWTVATSSSSSPPQAYHVELTTLSGTVVSRRSSKELSVVFTHLEPNTRYQVHVQAENAAGNGSSSSFVAFRTKESAPIIMSSLPNAKVVAGHSITLQCGHSHQDISWYIEDSDIPIARGHTLTIHHASVKDEGTYHCALEQGPKGSLKILVIVPPVISDLRGILLKQKQSEEDMDKHEIILLCETANRHPPQYAWTKDGAPLASKADTLKVSLDENAGAGKYECHVTNIAGSVSKSLVISPIGKTVIASDSSHRNSSTQILLTTAIAVLSFLFVIAVVVIVACVRTGKLRFKKKNGRKLITQSSSTEMTAVELTASSVSDSPRVVSRSPADVTQDHDDVFPYEVTHAWTVANRPQYMSLRRGDNSENEEDVTQVTGPDYFNISPSNRNDSAANCMYAPLRYTQGTEEKKVRPYANLDETGACNM